MVPITVQTLIVSGSPTPSVVVLRPIEDSLENGKVRIIPIWIGVHEASQLGMAMENARFSRPMTHDLFMDTITNLDATIDHVLINKVQGSTFFAQLVLKQYDRIIVVDARPSDALALALRQKAPLYMDEAVIKQASFPYSVKRHGVMEGDESELEDFREFLSTVVPEDFQA